MMGGRIWMESELGKGSTVHFTAQFGLLTAAAPLPVPANASALVGLRVVVVDDNQTNLRILQQVLVQWNTKPSTVSSATEAIELITCAQEAGRPFSLMITDSHMPEIDGFALIEEVRRNPQTASLKVVMLTSGGQRGDAARCRELAVAGYITKPAQQWELLETLLQVLGKPTAAEEPTRLVTSHSLREGRRSLHILLAEDNPVNQQLAARLLQKRSHIVVIAGDGKQALAALGSQRFDLVLMDVQMPEMDGVEATIAIRRREKDSLEHMPIIAMTAHVMAGDRERFLAAGMDGYLSKPIRSQELFAAIDRIISTIEAPNSESCASALQFSQAELEPGVCLTKIIP